jgi:adenylyltransferase/sulfurtransferase
MPVIPGRGPCLRCLFEDPPEHEQPTSTTVGVFGPAPAVVGALEAALAMRILAGDLPLPVRLLSLDVWSGEVESVGVNPSPDCATCGHLH